MFQALRSQIKFTKTKLRQNSSIQDPKAQILSNASPDLNYRDSRAVLVTKVNNNGQEMPIAIAFVNKRTRVAIYHLSELSEAD